MKRFLRRHKTPPTTGDPDSSVPTLLRVPAGVIDVHRGQTLTVWLDRSSDPGARDAIQVELRVTHNGGAQIFTDLDTIPFDGWYPL